MLIEKTKLDGVVIITPPVTHEDFRGTNTEIYNEKIYKDAGIHNDFILDSVSTSRQHVLRGIHGDEHTTKLISCLYGCVYMIVVNNDSQSLQYKKWKIGRAHV
jgi:dTDP-4-dehydrorhamnose 3,5-epimerase